MRSTALKIAIEQLPSTYPGLGLTFRLRLQNTWREKLALFFPTIECLRFTEIKRQRQRNWLNAVFVSACEFAFPIEPFASKDFVFECRYVEHFGEIQELDFDFERYMIDLAPGMYDVQYVYSVGYDYYDGDTHTRVEDLAEYATETGAIAWTGEVASNVLRVDRDRQIQKSG